MPNKKANFYGILLSILMFVSLIALFTTEPRTTGFAVKENNQDYILNFNINENTKKNCADGSFYGECSSLIKPKFCSNGELVDYCELCGCDQGEICSNRKCVKQ